MIWVIGGCAAFLPLYVFDLLKMRRSGGKTGLFFALGYGGIFVCTMGVLFQNGFMLKQWGWLLPGGAAFLMMTGALFFALPFSKTYVKAETNQVVDVGLYALCRHPGVLFFALMYFFLWLACGRVTMLAVMFLWTAMDVLHVWVQDRWLFPKTLEGYGQYQQTTPFLIPTAASFHRCLKTLG